MSRSSPSALSRRSRELLQRRAACDRLRRRGRRADLRIDVRELPRAGRQPDPGHRLRPRPIPPRAHRPRAREHHRERHTEHARCLRRRCSARNRCSVSSRFCAPTRQQKPAPGKSGDPARGKGLFEGKGECTDCHRIGTLGSHTGPDLTRIGLQRRAVDIEQLAARPEGRDPGEQSPRAARDGRRQGGQRPPAESRHVHRSAHRLGRAPALVQQEPISASSAFEDTPMPSAKKKLSSQQIADLVAYLSSLRGP